MIAPVTAIDTLAKSYAVIKGTKEGANYLWRFAKNLLTVKSHPLDTFRNKEVTIVASALYASKDHPLFAIRNGQMIGVSTGYFVTGFRTPFLLPI